MARTKQTDKKPGHPPPATVVYICTECGHESSQSTNHGHHMYAHHGLHPDGTMATAEIASAQGWNHRLCQQISQLSLVN